MLQSPQAEAGLQLQAASLQALSALLTLGRLLTELPGTPGAAFRHINAAITTFSDFSDALATTTVIEAGLMPVDLD